MNSKPRGNKVTDLRRSDSGPRPAARSKVPMDRGRPRSEKQPKVIAGAPLIRAINVKAIELSLSSRELAEVLGVTYTYFISLQNGHRALQGLSKERFEKIANFLQVPVIQCYVWAEVFNLSDFIYSEGLADRLDLSIEKMRVDKRWGALVPSRHDWEIAPESTRLLITLLYEKVCDRVILNKVKAGPILASLESSERRAKAKKAELK